MSAPRLITAEGSSYEIGEQLGEATTDIIDRMVRHHHKDRLLRRDRAFQSTLGRLEGNTRRIAPELLEEIKGISSGSGIPYQDIFAYNCLTEVSGMVLQSCTNIGFADTEVGPAIAKTNDGDAPDCDWFYVIEHIRHAHGLSVLMATWAGTVWLVAGINSHGLAITAASSDGLEENWDGLPTNMLTRLALEKSASVPEALRLMSNTPFTLHSMSITVADRMGELAVLERSPTSSVLRRPENGGIFCVNHFLDPSMFSENNSYTPEYLNNSRRRERHLENLLRQDMVHSTRTLEDILEDAVPPGAMCQLGQDELYTNMAAILMPAVGRIKVVLGPPCTGSFEEYSI